MRLCDIIETYISGDWGNDEPTEDACCPVSCIRGADIVPIYNSEYNNIPLRYISEKSLSNRALQEGDIVIEKSGGSPTQSTGRVVYISKELLDEKQNIVCSNFCAALRIKPEWDAYFVSTTTLWENAIRPLALRRKNYLFCGCTAMLRCVQQSSTP